MEASLARLRQLPDVLQRRAACLLGAIVADTASEAAVPASRLVYAPARTAHAPCDPCTTHAVPPVAVAA